MHVYSKLNTLIFKTMTHLNFDGVYLNEYWTNLHRNCSVLILYHLERGIECSIITNGQVQHEIWTVI